MFHKAVLYDSWLYPIREDAESMSSTAGVNSNVLFVNCQKFQSRKNLETMKHFDTSLNGIELKTNVITLRDTFHYARKFRLFITDSLILTF